MGNWTPLLLAAFVATAAAVPTGLRYTCANTCSDAKKFAFERGMSYEYNYEATTDVVTDAETEAVKMDIGAKAVISVLAPCELSLSLENVVLDGSDSSEFSSELTKKPLRFAFDDGLISTICSDEAEPVWVTNFKRGVLTAFQNSMDGLDEARTVQYFDEVGIVGKCETRYEIESAEDTYVITRSSDKCSNIPVSSTTSLPLALHQVPLVSSNFYCRQTVVAGIIQSAECRYQLELRAVSDGGSGAINYGKTSLELVNVVPSGFISETSLVKSSLEFDASLDMDTVEGHIRSVEAILSDLNQPLRPLVKSEMPILFSQLVENLRHLNQRQLSILYEANRNSRLWRYLVDAAPLVGTPASMLIIRDLIISGQLTEQETQAWFTSLAFIPRPKVEMFRPLPELMANSFSKEALLGVSAMVNAYCKIDSDCAEKTEIKEILSLIEFNLGSACRSASFEEKETILVVLKSLGNAGHWTNPEVVKNCYTEVENPVEVRVAALEAWRRAPCTYDRSGLLGLYENTHEDSEIRIAAYLSLMACPNQELIDTIKDRLTSESVNQVGSFVWTHLTNLQESASHEKQWIRRLIGEEMLVNKFNTTGLKLSRNFESSFYMAESGYGATFDSNLIFSSKSFLPRSAMLNFTLDLFGESINMFEIGGRIEGFEIFAERFFGPNGYYPEETVEAILQNLRKSQNGPETTLEHMLDVVTSEPEGSYYLRVLDNDVKYHHFRGIDNFFEKKPGFDLIQTIVDFAKTGKTEYTKSYKLIDTELTYPTITGLPMILKLNSTATLGFVLAGKFAMTSFSSIDIDGTISPSAAVQVDATMLVDAHVSKSGLKVTSNIHSSAYFEGKVKIEGGKVADISLQMPEEKINLLSVHAERIFIKNDRQLEPEIPRSVQKKCTPTSTGFGLQLCSEYSLGDGFTDASVYVEKTDSHTGYTFRYLNEENMVSLLIDTPGSRVDRRFSFIATRDDDEVKIDVHTPWKFVKASGKKMVGDTVNMYDLELMVDNAHKYQASAGYSVTREGPTTKIVPTLVIRTPSRNIVDFSGHYKVDPESRSIDISLENTGMFGFIYSFATSRTITTSAFNTKLISAMAYGEVSGSINTEDGFLSQIDLKYSLNKQREQTFSNLIRVNKIIRGDTRTYSSGFSISSSQFPWMSLHSKVKYQDAPGRTESSLSINYGVDAFVLDVDKVVTYSYEDRTKNVEAHVTVVSPTHNLNTVLNEKVILRQNYLLLDAEAKFSPTNEFKTKTELGYSDVEAFARFKTSWEAMNVDKEINFSSTKISDNHYNAELTGHCLNASFKFLGSFRNTSVRGQSVHYIIAAKSLDRFDEIESTSHIVVSADRQKALFDIKASYLLEEYFTKLEATRTSFKLDSNFWKNRVTFTAEIIPEGETKSVTVSGVWGKDEEATEFGIDGALTSTSASGHFKFGNVEKSFHGELEASGANVLIKLDAEKIIKGKLSYNYGETTQFTASLETPFESYEAHTFDFKFSKVNRNEFESYLTIVARNTKLVEFAAKGKVEINNQVKEARVSSSLQCHKGLFGAELLTFELAHTSTGFDVDSSMSGIVDGREILTGNLKTSLASGIRTVSANLVTPFTENLEISVHHVLFRSINSEFKYGERYAVLRYEKRNLPDGSGIEYDIDLKSSDSEPLKMLTTVKRSSTSTNIVIEYSHGSLAAQAFFDHELKQTGTTVKNLGNLRIILPNRAPITGSGSVTFVEKGKHITEFELTRFWSSYGTVKGHFTTSVNPGRLMLDGSYTSPDVRASIDTKLAYGAYRVDSYLKYSWNGVQKEASLKCSYDPQLQKGKLRNSWIVGESEVFKLGLDHEKDGNKYITTMKIKKLGSIHNIHHEITLTDKFNWVNKLTVNEDEFFNKMMHVDRAYTHSFNWNFGSKFIRGRVSSLVDHVTQYYMTGDLNLSTSWTKDITSEIKYEMIDSMVFKPEVMVKYGEDQLLLKSVCSCLPEECSVKLDLETTFWDQLTFEGAYRMSPEREIKIVFTKGVKTTAVDMTGQYDSSKISGSLRVISDYMQFPIAVEANYIRAESSTVAIAIEARKTFKGTITYSPLTMSGGSVLIELDVPCVYLNKSKLLIEYGFAFESYAVLLEGNLSDMTMNAKGVLSSNSLHAEIKSEDLHELKINLALEADRGNASAIFTSQANPDYNIQFSGDYQFAPGQVKRINITAKGSAFTYLYAQELQENKGNLDSSLTFYSEKYDLTAAYGNSEYLLHCGNSKQAIDVQGKYNLNNQRGNISLQLSTPFQMLENGSFDMEYNLFNTKAINFSFTLGELQMSCAVEADVNDWKTPKFSISGTSHLESLKTFGAKMEYNSTSSKKELHGEVTRDSEKISGDLEYSWDQEGSRLLVAKLSSPFRGYESTEIGGLNIKVVDNQYEANLFIHLNGELQEYEFKAFTGDQQINGHILSTSTSWKKIAFNGQVEKSDEKVFGTLSVQIDDVPFTLTLSAISKTTDEEKSVDISVTTLDQRYHCKAYLLTGNERGVIKVELVLPTNSFRDLVTYSFDGNYNMANVATAAEITAAWSDRYSERTEKLAFIMDYSSTRASISLAVPFTNEEFGIHYSLDLDEINNTFKGFLEGKMFSETYIFGANAAAKSNLIEIEIVTPFEGYRRTLARGEVSVQDKYINTEVIIGEYEAKFEVRYSLQQPLLEIKTPFEILRHFKLSFDYKNTSEMLELSAAAKYNSHNFGVGGILEPAHEEKMIKLYLLSADQRFELSGGAYFGRDRVQLAIDFQSPIPGFDNVGFTTKLDWTSEEKVIEISLKNQGDVSMISLNGNFVSDEIDLKIQSPFSGLENFHTRGALNRSKRSLGFTMMNDRAEGEILASFNSLTVKVASVYPAINDATLTIEKPDAGGFALHYKRASDVHFDFTATPTGRSRQYDITVDAVVPAWDFKALIGEMHRDELLPYLEGQQVHPRSTIRGGGTYSRTESDLKFDITTPRQNFESITAILKKNIRRSEYKLEITSSSDFHILINSKPDFTVDIFVPNPAEPTIIKADLSLLKGSINISSRFSRWRTFNWQYEATVGRRSLTFNASLERNGVQTFSTEFERDASKAHLKIEGRSGENHSVIHFHRQGFELISFSFNRNGKEFKLEAQGTGDLPSKGSLDVVVNNSFRAEPITVTAHVEVDRTGSPKTVKIEATYPGNRLYVIDTKYNIDLRRQQVGDYDIRITTPDRRAYPWQHLAGSWDLRDHENAVIKFESARAKVSVQGKIYLREGDVVLTREVGSQVLTRNLAWRLYKTSTLEERTRDYYIKYGTDEKFIMAKLKGTFSGLQRGNTEYEFQLFPKMSNSVTGSVRWQRDSSGLSGDGSFESGQYSGTYTLKKLKREAATRSLVLSFEANTNIPDFSHVTAEGEYNFDHQAFVKLDIRWDTNNISINLNVQDITSNFTQQTASLHLPSLGDINVTFGHDFRDKRSRKFTAVAQVNDRQSTLNAEWSRNKDFTKLSGNVDIQSISLGHITIEGQYDVRDLNKAKAEIKYTRNEDKHVRIKWTRNVTEAGLKAEVLFESHFRVLPRGKILVEATFENGVHFNFLAQGRTEGVKANFDVEANSITGEITTPFPGLEKITGSLIFNLEDRNHKTVTLRYLRGDRAVNLDLNLDLASQRQGTLKVALETPFTFVRTLNLDASWNDNHGEVHYKRNDIAYSFTGQAAVRTDGTSFEIQFTPTSEEPVKLAFNFNPGSFISGEGSQSEEVAKIEFEILGKRVAFNLRGYRNRGHLLIDVKSESNLEFIQVFEVTLDSELNRQRRNGLFEIKVNDFHFKMRNFFERRGENGFYLRSHIDSTITDLPGVTIGVGKEGDERTITIGVGEDRELTVAYTPKDNFKRGLSGRITAPRRGIHDAAFDIGYSFSGPNVLNINYEIELEPGKKSQASIEYNSDGVQARFGDYRLRVKRSITDEGFSADVGFNDYNLSLRGDAMHNGIKKGFIVNGEVFGTKVSIDAFLQTRGRQYLEGKFIVSTSLRGYENLGGFFTYSKLEKKVNVRSEINLPSHVVPKIFLFASLDGTDKISGTASIDLSGQVFSIDANLESLSASDMEGHVVIKTPYHLLSEVNIDGKFRRTPDSILAEAKFECSYTGKLFEIELNHSKQSGAIKTYTMVKVKEQEIDIDYEKNGNQINGKLNVISYLLRTPISVTFSGNIPRTMSITATVSGISHAFSYTFYMEQKKFTGSFMIDSYFVGRRRMITIAHDVPDDYLRDNFDFEVSYSYTPRKTFIVLLNVDRQNGFEATATFETPNGTQKAVLFLDHSASKIEAIIYGSLARFGEHKVNFTLLRPSNIPLVSKKLSINMSIESSMLLHDIVYSLEAESTDGIYMFRKSVTRGGITETCNVGYSFTDDRAYLLVDVDSSLPSIGKARISADIVLRDIIGTVVEIGAQGQFHSFEVKFDQNRKEMTAILKSPLVPGSFSKAQISVNGNSLQKLTTYMALNYAQATYAGKLDLEAESARSIEATLEVITPVEGYKKMNFEFHFEYDDELQISFFAGKPFGFKFALASDRHFEGYDTAVDIITPISGFEKISASLKVPLYKKAAQVNVKLPNGEYGFGFETGTIGFTRMFSVNMNRSGAEYVAGYSLRTKAPYELAMEANSPDHPRPWRFHIMADPSMTSFLTSNIF